MISRLLKYALLFGLLAGCGMASRQDGDVPGIKGLVMTQAGADVSFGQEAPSVQVRLSDGPGIASLINNHYNETIAACPEQGTNKVRGLYFCTGVLLRTTDNGPFNPWLSSPTALRLYGTSYSWIRHDLRTTTFYKRAGFILLSPADVKAGTVPGITYPKWSPSGDTFVTCVYPFDAWTTRNMDRGRSGCDFEGTGLGHGASSWGSCDERLGYTTVTQWNDHFIDQNYINYRQCSWGADNAQGWRNMIASHNTFPGQAPWNEVMLWNGGPEMGGDVFDGNTQGWIVAFFYDAAKSNALDDARAFQQKMAQAPSHSKRVPVLRLDFSVQASSRFTYRAIDQAPGFYP